MIQVAQITARLKTKPAILAILLSLALLNLGRYGVGKYQDYLADLESKQALLGQYRIMARGLEDLRQRVAGLAAKKEELDTVMFTGESVDEIASAMQLKAQELLAPTGLQPESLRPQPKNSDRNADKRYGEVTIKVRLSGKIEQFIAFLAEIYRLPQFFKIEDITMKPEKKDDIKIFFDLKGFYKITESAPAAG